MLLVSALIAAACISCSEATTGPKGIRLIVAEYYCVATLRQHTLACEVPASPDGAGRFALYGSSQVKLTSSSVHYDSVTQIFGFDVNVKNLLSLTIGTTTGTDTVGVKAFYESGPTGTSFRSPGDTGTVSVNNADGYANFTGAHQAYHFYRHILAPSAVTPNHRWEIHCPPTVPTFSFVLRVFTRTQVSPGVGDTVPRHQYISEDSLQALYAPSKVIYGHPRGSGPYPRAVLFVAFRQEASADERQAAIDLVGGSLVLGDGVFYHLVVQDDGTANPLWQAIDRLRALPQVEFAGPDWTMGIGPLKSTGPGVSESVPTTLTISDDSLRALYARGKVTFSHPRLLGVGYPRSLLLLGFQSGATADEREAAINLVSGKSIGGDGMFYYILIRDDGTADPLWAAIDQLRALPQVRFAAPDLTTLNTTTTFRLPNDAPTLPTLGLDTQP